MPPKDQMKRITLLLAALLPLATSHGQEKAKSDDQKETDKVFRANFDDLTPGPVPASYFVVEGTWSIAELDGGKVLHLAEVPIVDAQVQLGDSLKDAGGTVTARIKAERKRRSFPRFGVGLHGMSGFRLRLFPAQNKLELVRNEEVVTAVPLTWDASTWWHLELTVAPAEAGWTVAGRAWAEGTERPDKPQIEATSDEPKFSGKASVFGTAFAGLPLHFDDISITPIPRPDAAKK